MLFYLRGININPLNCVCSLRLCWTVHENFFYYGCIAERLSCNALGFLYTFKSLVCYYTKHNKFAVNERFN